MKALRIRLTQSSANYRKEETIDNKMTYPLPPLSTVIGALHAACGYTEYHPMKISIQGKYESMHKEAYTDYCFLNSTMDDRGILVHMSNESMLSRAYDKVASAKKSQGNSFRNNITINIHHDVLMNEYWRLKELGDEIQEFKKTRFQPLLSKIKIRKATLGKLKKEVDKQSLRYEHICRQENEIKEIEKEIKERMKLYEEENYSTPISRYRSLTTSLKFYEVLDNVTLILHVQAEAGVLQDIKDNIYNLRAIGRSEDMVQLEEIKLVELQEELVGDELTSEYSAYIDIDLIRSEKIFTKQKNKKRITGTKYLLNKNYEIVNNQRIFEKKKVLYASEYWMEEVIPGKNLYADGKYIVNLL